MGPTEKLLIQLQSGMMLLFLLFFFIGIPLILTLINSISLFMKKRKKSAGLTLLDSLIFILGIPFSALLWWFWYMLGEDLPVSGECLPTILTLVIIAIAGYWVTRIGRTRLPLPICVASYSAMLIGCLMSILLVMQMASNIIPPIVMLMLLPYNYVLCVIRLMYTTGRDIAEVIGGRVYSSPLLLFSQRMITSPSGLWLLSLVFSVLLFGVITALLVLFGQSPYAFVVAFTDTVGYTFSQ